MNLKNLWKNSFHSKDIENLGVQFIYFFTVRDPSKATRELADEHAEAAQRRCSLDSNENGIERD